MKSTIGSVFPNPFDAHTEVTINALHNLDKMTDVDVSQVQIQSGIQEILKTEEELTVEEILMRVHQKKVFGSKEALQLLDAGEEGTLFFTLQAFHNLSTEVAMRMLKFPDGGLFLAGDLDSFDVDELEIAMRMIDVGQGRYVIEKIQNFKKCDHNIILKRIIQKEVQEREKIVKLVMRYFKNFSNLDAEIALFLMNDEVCANHVCENIGVFSEQFHREIAIRLIEAEYLWTFIGHIQNFRITIDEELIVTLLAKVKEISKIKIGIDYDYWLASKLETFPDLLDTKFFALQLIKFGKADTLRRKIEYFPNLDKEVALALLEAGDAKILAENAQYFSGLDKEIALTLLHLGFADWVGWKLKHYSNLDKEVAVKFFDLDMESVVKDNIDLFVDSLWIEVE